MTSAALSLESFIKGSAYGLGFDLVGITGLGPAETAPRFESWLARGHAGEMAYLERGAEKRRDSRSPFAPATSAIVVALEYGGREASGSIARYARGDDYHELMTERLRELHRSIERETGRDVRARPYVDTGPILERDLARKAGLGWFGKNSNLINPAIGSFFFLGSLIIDLDLDADSPFDQQHCGTCRRCIDACPTDAIVEDGLLDATRCISYLTIESRSAIPEWLRPAMGELIYGCDICQEVCPWNVRFARDLKEPAFRSRAAVRGLGARALARNILAMSDEDLAADFRGSPMKRAKLRGLKRNAAIALGNAGDEDDLAALTAARDDADELINEHAAWAIERIGLSHRRGSAVR